MNELTPKTPSQPFVNTVSPKDAAREEGKTAPPYIPPQTDVSPSPEPHEYRCHCRPDQTPWWKHAVELAAVLVGITVALIYYRQLQTMSAQLGEMIKQSPEITKSADAAASAADTAKKTLDASGKAFQVEQRAYVYITAAMMSTPPICIIPGKKDTRVCADVHVANSGKTPAIGPRIVRYATFGENAEKMIKKMKIPSYDHPEGGMLGNIGDQFGTAATDPVDEKTAHQLVDGDESIYIYGVIQYFDIFSAYHETGFCSRRVPKSISFIDCGFGNWFDVRPDYTKQAK